MGLQGRMDLGVQPLAIVAHKPPRKHGRRDNTDVNAQDMQDNERRSCTAIVAMYAALGILAILAANGPAQAVYNTDPLPKGASGQAVIAPQTPSPLLSSQQRFLPVEEAFIFTVEAVAPGQIIARWEMPDGYYLYRHGFQARIDGQQHGDLGLPPGQAKTDPYFGAVIVYYHSVALAVNLPNKPGKIREIRLQYQGCAEAGLCYPPTARMLHLTPDGTVNDMGLVAAQTPAALAVPEVESEQGRLVQLLIGSSLALSLGVFFLSGIGLALTPCVLPMAPILSAVVVGATKLNRSRAAALSLVYVGAMAIVYASLGVLIGLFGAQMHVQAILQNVWVLALFAGIFVLLALSMFGLYELQLPRPLRDRLASLSATQQGGGLRGAALLGILSALLVSPCISAPLAGALVYISTTEDALFGGLALFVLALGMGLPILLFGVGVGGLLPRAGPWMQSIRTLFGLLLLALAIWILERALAGWATMLLWSALAVGAALYLWRVGAAGRALERRIFQRLASTALLLYGSLLVVGAVSGGSDPLHPLGALRDPSALGASFAPIVEVHRQGDLMPALRAARDAGQPAMLEFRADWCVSCRIMESSVFPDSRVRQAATGMRLVRIDLTANMPWQRDLLIDHGLFGPPAFLFFDPRGLEARAYRIQGEVSAADFAEHLTSFRRQFEAPDPDTPRLPSSAPAAPSGNRL